MAVIKETGEAYAGHVFVSFFHWLPRILACDLGRSDDLDGIPKADSGVMADPSRSAMGLKYNCLFPLDVLG
jgi:hypothetical protein